MLQTPLHWASKRGYSRIVLLLIDYGSKLESKDLMGRTPLYLAAEMNNRDIIKVSFFRFF